MAPRLLGWCIVDVASGHREELERLTLKRLPLAMLVVAGFIGGALPIELYFYANRLRPYLTTYAAELAVCGIAWLAVRRWPGHARAVATLWGGVLGVCVAAYYPLVHGDANVAMTALICLVCAIPAVLPFGVVHQLVFGSICALAFFGVLASGLPTSLPWQYSFVAFVAVLTTSSIGAESLARFRWETYEREAILRQAHDQLRAALARAQEAVEVRSRLVANVSHELRTPLNVIVGYADMLVDSAADATVKDAAPRIRDYAVSLEALVNDLLDMSRLTCGKMSVNAADVELRPLLEDVARGARTIAGAKPVDVVVGCGLERLATDALRLGQILTNLATNAAKFTEQGTIELRAERERDTAVFTVRDTGPGIAPEQHEAIFAAFEQLAPQHPGKSNGVGLGLAIVRQLTDLLGGTVGVTSVVGEGSMFTVRLPILAAARDAA